jgi:hypothetical protein
MRLAPEMGTNLLRTYFPVEDMKAAHRWSGIPIGGVTTFIAVEGTVEAIGKAQSPSLRLYDTLHGTDTVMPDPAPELINTYSMLLLATAGALLGTQSTLSRSIVDQNCGLLSNPTTELLEFASRRRLMHVLAPFAREDERIRQYAGLTAVVSRAQEFEKKGLFNALARHGVPAIELKGTDLFAYYGSVFSRRFNDVDILVPSPRLDAAIDLIRSNGFRQGYLDWPESAASPTMQPLRRESDVWVRGNHHEIHPLYKVVPVSNDCLQEIRRYSDTSIGKARFGAIVERHGKLNVVVKLDLHFNLASDFDESDIWKDVVAGEEPDRTLRLSPEVYALFFLGRAYYDNIVCGGNDLRSLVDGAAVIRRGIDVAAFVALVEKYKAFAPVYYCSRLINAFFDEIVSADLVELCGQRLVKERLFDLGDVAPRMLGAISPLPL